MNALAKIMGALFLCVGIPFAVNGLLGIATEATRLQQIQATLSGN